MPQERLPKQTIYTEVNGKRPVGQPRTFEQYGLIYNKDLGCNRLGLHPSEMQFVFVDQ